MVASDKLSAFPDSRLWGLILADDELIVPLPILGSSLYGVASLPSTSRQG